MKQTMMDQEINFEIISSCDASKKGHVVAIVKFHKNPSKNYTYVRKYWGGTNDTFTIDGCKVTVTRKENEFGVEHTIERIYETSGVKKLKSTGKSKNQQTQVTPEEPKVQIDWNDEDVKHEKYEIIKTCLLSEIPVYLSGPAGSGKNFTIEQIAKELGWDFYFSNAVQQEFKITGFIDAGGDYHETEFYKACTSSNKSIFFLDEIDASIPEVLVLLNAAIANGYFEFPTGRVNLNNVHFVAAGNTVGSGADENYTGRFVLDQATLDRFAIIEFTYSRMIEMKLAKGNEELVDYVRTLREKAEENGIRTTFSYRCITMVTKLEEQNMNLQDILKITVFKGLDKDTINTLKFVGNGKYTNAAMLMA